MFLFGSDFIPIPGNGSGLQLKTGNGNERKLLQNEKVKPENQFSKKTIFVSYYETPMEYHLSIIQPGYSCIKSVMVSMKLLIYLDLSHPFNNRTRPRILHPMLVY